MSVESPRADSEEAALEIIHRWENKPYPLVFESEEDRIPDGYISPVPRYLIACTFVATEGGNLSVVEAALRRLVTRGLVETRDTNDLPSGAWTMPGGDTLLITTGRSEVRHELEHYEDVIRAVVRTCRGGKDSASNWTTKAVVMDTHEYTSDDLQGYTLTRKGLEAAESLYSSDGGDQDPEDSASIPPLDLESGKWIRAVAVAGRLKTCTDALKMARSKRRCPVRLDDGSAGRDAKGRVWQVDPTDKQIVWYLKSSLK